MSDVVPLVDAGLGNASYLVDLGDGRALAVDPTRHPGPYLAAAAARGLAVAFTADTHLHADFVSGSGELAALGATALALAGGDEVDLGAYTLRALATPGHTPEHLSYLLLDGDTPVALFSGGSLLAGTVARTDLTGPDRTESLARDLWRALHDRVLVLPDDLVVFPTHGAGSFCSAPARPERVTSIGREKETNPLLAARDEDAFVEALLAGFGPYPPYFHRLPAVNRRGPRLYGPGPGELARLTPGEVERLARDGAVVVDARPVEAFARAHVPGSVSIAWRDAFATWLGWLVAPDVPLVFVLDAGQDRDLLVRDARKIGYERLGGEIAGGVDAWTATGRPVATIALDRGAPGERTVVDVRERAEFETGHVPGARHVPLGDVPTTRLPDGPLALMCGHGERAMSAASLLARAGRDDLTVLMR